MKCNEFCTSACNCGVDDTSSVVFLDRTCVCGHADSEHVVHYYQTGNRAPICERRGCKCTQFRLT